MIFSYESLIQEWVKSGQPDNIIKMWRKKHPHMEYFLKRDSNDLLNLVRNGDHCTLIALLRCFDDDTIQNLRTCGISDKQLDIIYNIDNSECLAGLFLCVEISRIKENEKLLIV